MIHLQKISINQLFCLVILTQVGAHVISIPYPESRHSGHDSWMSILIGGVIAQVVILFIYLLGKRYAFRPLPQYISTITGKWIGSVLNFLFAAYCAESSLMVVVSYSDVLDRWVLFNTPWFVIIGISIAVAAYIATSTLRSIATITQSIVIMYLISFVIIVISGLGKGDWRHLLPIGSHRFQNILQDSLPAFWAYAGYELLLYVFPFIKCSKKKDIIIAMSVANGFTTFFYVLMSVIVTYNFGENLLNSIPEPMVFILRKFRWPIVQSLDILFMTIWLSVTTVTVYVYLFLSARYLAFVGNKEIRNHTLLVWILAIICFVIGLWGHNRQWLFRFSNYHNTATAIMVAIVPTILFLISLARGKVASR
ncbi:spore germination protein (amino acid permease) [Bacillus sp. SORGH_AS 510]|uniref:GerAB/ArcD/ProY family transporter n=1 Tax=Bacillus sp. SORGH_AS_0510 TaxID=3041771 RepID=UPI00278AB44A|nr:GerAB/ArcD/ProY family transporter [Bacillus sp. SORGH_AS_0510]MDQ1143890.1 spore germination protein (amino acid permease) [Bacillus sp. SORGH_AS_0510]